MEGVRAAISQGPGRVIFLILIAFLFVMSMYQLYKWLGGGSDQKDYILYNSPDGGLPGKNTTHKVYTSPNVPGIYEGGEVSVSTWVYVTDWGTNQGKNKVILTLSGGSTTASYNTLVIYLGTNTNKLGVRVSYDADSKITTGATSKMTDLQNGTGIYSDTSSNTNNGDIDNIALQKWVNITVVLAGRTLDVYIDGKLSRSTVLSQMYKVDSDKPTVKIGGPDGFGGIIGKTRIANFAYAPDQVYKNYYSGPFDNSLLGMLWAYINPGQYSVEIKKTE